MSNDEIKELIGIFISSGVEEMEVKRGENALRLRRGYAQPPKTEITVTPAIPAQTPAAGFTEAPAAPSPADYTVTSPIVGTYYDSPKPGAPPFVRVGDSVEAGQILCIIESMKLMNEIESDVSGVVAGKLMENGRPVEYGEALFAIRRR